MSRELIFSITKKDFDIQFFSGTGAGGQNRNKNQNCVRMVHRASGVRATGQSHRNQVSNLREAFNGIVKSKAFQSWLKKETSMRMFEGVSIAEKIKRMMSPENLKVEYYTP